MRYETKVAGGDKAGPYLRQLATRLKSGEVRVGFLEGATYPAEGEGKPTLPVAQVAFWNEFGTSKAPPRPFFRTTVTEKSREWGSDMAKIAKATGSRTHEVLRLMGERIKDQLVKAIVDWPADNAPSTVARKGFNKGLVEHGVMQRSVDYEVKT